MSINMIKLDDKYIFHLPLYKYANEELIAIDSSIISNLMDLFNEKGYENAYVMKVKGYYKSRSFDELLITIFTSSTDNIKPDSIFKDWFIENNDILEQDSFAYEYNDEMFIFEL
ncbi:MAG: hypothetical protein Q4P14_00930 [Methanobacteriaceae archaeon]|nr:hypothetical protein [Methanobacteriaceae archaeon]